MKWRQKLRRTYTTKPIQWSYRGMGEILIGFCYGWLPVAASCYIQIGQISPLVHWVSLPIAFTIFNVILINEFPDYPADREFGKKNLVVRFGKERMSKLYALMSFAALCSYVLAIITCVPIKAFFSTDLFSFSLFSQLFMCFKVITETGKNWRGFAIKP
ncbi:MAG: prenyltransferase [Nitrospirota bacterium]